LVQRREGVVALESPTGADMSRERRQGTIRGLIWIASGLIAVAVLAIGLTVWGFHSDAIDEATNDVNNIAIIMAEQTARSVEAIDRTLSELQHMAALAGGSVEERRRTLATRQTHELLKERVAQLPQAAVITLADEQGRLIASSRGWPTETLDISDRDFFRSAKQHPEINLAVSAPVASRVSGAPSIFFAKPLRSADGFAGVAIVGVELTYFRHVYDSITSLRDKTFLFLRDDGTILVRHPDVRDRAGEMMPASSPWFQLVAQGGGTYRSPGFFDGIARWVAVRPVPGYPLVVDVAVAENVALATWQRRATLIGIGTLLVACCSILLLRQLARQFRRLIDSELSLADREAKVAQKSRELAQANAHLDTALNNMSQGLLLFDAEERVVVCNGRYIEMYGLSPEIVKPGAAFRDLLEHRKTVGTFSGDVGAYRAAVARDRAEGKATELIVQAAGRTIRIVNQPLPSGGWVATHEDVTERERLLRAQNEAERLLRSQKLQLDAALNNMNQGLCMFDAEGRVVLLNQRFAEMKGVPAESLQGISLLELIKLRRLGGVDQRDVEQVCAEILARVRSGRPTSELLELPNGRSWRMVDQPMANGGWIATFEDITEQRELERERDRNREFLDTIINAVPMPVVVKNAHDRRYAMVNDSGVEYFSVARDRILGSTAHDIWPPDTADLITLHDDDVLRSSQCLYFEDFPIDSPSRGARIITAKGLAIRNSDGVPQYLLTVIEDVTERKRSEAQIVYMAHHDLLTGLPNRAFFMEKLEEAGARLRRWGEPFTVLILDLDRFKIVNDSLGHPAGDALLKETATRLKTALRETDVLARLGGDEFAIIQVGEIEHRDGAALLAQRIIELVRAPYVIEGSAVGIGTSIGIAVAPADGNEPTQLIKNADLALYRGKSQGRNGYCFFDVEMTRKADARHQLENDLRDAIARSEFELFYQPIVEVASTRLRGAEALVRWRHPLRGLVPPDQFIPLAEETGLINALGEWVVQKACADAAAWPKPLKVSVNLSALQFRNSNLLDVILCALVESGLPPDRLELEITESVLLESDTDPLAVIRRLKNLGVSLALDDFGTGYSSLSYLTKFPFDKIKIDKSFTQQLTKRAECAAIISSVRALGIGLNMLTVAEGVETEQQLTLLRAAGVDLAQGYLFGRPCPLSDFRFDDDDQAEALATRLRA
jgi:diguanylate cyclase (GGDEF)-like protein/PAS domain S-box-containing protein